MISVPGYKQIELLNQGPHSIVYSGSRSQDNQAVILRQLRPELTTPELVSRQQREYELLREFDSPFVIKPFELVEAGGASVLVTEKPIGMPLIDFVEAGSLSILEAAKIGQLIASAIDDLHGYNVVHKDINPANVIYDRDNSGIKLIDFGISTAISPNHIKPESSRMLEGNLAYLSPEQTGRMNRTIDFRTDFYSLGVTLYQLLTGKLPFASEDRLELIYQHMALTPESPDKVNPEVPQALSKITLKLLSKLPEDRYQSAVTVIQDLERFLDLKSQGIEDPVFDVALDDIPEQLNISERLLEREPEQEQLKEQLDNLASGQSATIICIGESGIGKSALIHELEKEVITRGGYVAKGTHNPITVEVPYTAVSAVLNDLAKQLASRSHFLQKKQTILHSLNGLEEPFLTLAPELTAILDYEVTDHTPVSDAAKPRLVRGITAFLTAIADERTPLVISLDNLHWIDSASLDLFEDLFGNNRLPHVFLIGAYRSLALEQTDTNRIRIGELLENNPQIQLLRLKNLTATAVNRMISDSLFRAEEETLEFAKLVVEKTDGNPLAIREFLNRLYAKGLKI